MVKHRVLAMDQDWIAQMFFRDLHPIIVTVAAYMTAVLVDSEKTKLKDGPFVILGCTACFTKEKKCSHSDKCTISQPNVNSSS